MALKYQNQLKISLNKVQIENLRKLSQKYGMSYQDVIRKALDEFARVELIKSWTNLKQMKLFQLLQQLKLKK